jgi:hypothetical protein
MRTQATLVALSAAVLLAACGGGDDSAPPTSEVPPGASTSIDGFVDYLKKLVASSADTLEPVDTAAVTGPSDETSEPQKVD